jgi:hypothetical protein
MSCGGLSFAALRDAKGLFTLSYEGTPRLRLLTDSGVPENYGRSGFFLA